MGWVGTLAVALTITHILKGGVVRGKRRGRSRKRRATQGGDHDRDDNGRRRPQLGTADVWSGPPGRPPTQQAGGAGRRADGPGPSGQLTETTGRQLGGPES